MNLKQRVRFRTPHAEETVLQEILSTEPSPDHHLEVKLRNRTLAECIASLPEVYQSALRLYYWLGAGVEEVADLLGAPRIRPNHICIVHANF